jgi:hypothetical protein
MLNEVQATPQAHEDPSVIYGLLPAIRDQFVLPEGTPELVERLAVHRLSLAFRCLVNLGVRGTETVRMRLQEAGCHKVVQQMLEKWMIGKGFFEDAQYPSELAHGPPVQATSIHRWDEMFITLPDDNIEVWGASDWVDGGIDFLSTSDTIQEIPENMYFHDEDASRENQEEYIVLSLMLLAYLSKYPHIRQAFYSQEGPVGAQPASQ